MAYRCCTTVVVSSRSARANVSPPPPHSLPSLSTLPVSLRRRGPSLSRDRRPSLSLRCPRLRPIRRPFHRRRPGGPPLRRVRGGAGQGEEQRVGGRDCVIEFIAMNPRVHVNQGQCLAKTSSRCVVGSITATHDFEVTNFSLLDGMGTGKFVSSRNFSVGGYDWNIRLYPDGAAAGHKAYVSAFLRFEGGKTDEVRVKFSLSLLGRDGQVKLFSDTDTFKTVDGCKGQGWNEFIQKSELKPLLRLNNDSFTIRCVVTVIKDPQIEDVSAIVVPQSNLLQDFAQMLKDGEGADVTFSVGDQLFPAHRYVLAARSPVLKADLFSPMKEKATKHITIDDMEPSIFEALLHFIYTDTLPEDSSTGDTNVTMQHLLVAADRYGLERLRLMCEAKLSHGIDVQTVATTLTLAEQHHCVQLKNACLRFIASPDVLPAIMKTDGYKHLVASCQLVVQEILKKIAAVATE